MIDRRRLLKDLQGQVKNLETDLREQVGALPEVYGRLRAEYDRAFKLGRTAATWTVWRDERVTQAAVAWVLGTVFVRFCEDNGLLGGDLYLAGPSVQRMALAEESHEEHFRAFPSHTDRDWLLAAFGHIGQSQAGRLLFDSKHNAAYQIPVSHDAAKALIGFWRRRGEDGVLVHDFADESWDTRFLGDLYQDLSEYAKKTYALLQTPEFVEEFILGLTLTPAIEEFGYDVVRMIDPTCGSGHFLLGTFHRLLKEWEREAPARDAHERVRLALDAVHGVDINPFAVAIARFRLLVTALKAAGFETLEEAKGYEFPLHIAIGDSLIKYRQLALFDDVDELGRFLYATEDLDEHPGILTESRYHVVVGNPPYVAVKDSKISGLYRRFYPSCVGAYTLSVPFAVRFFELAKRGDSQSSGLVGQITANSFMRQNFGRKLVEYFDEHTVLTHLVDASGAYIPGHGTPTVLIFGRPGRRRQAHTVRVAMAICGEPAVPADASQGKVWRAVVDQVHRPGSVSKWIEVLDVLYSRLAHHPWSLSGGGAGDLKEFLDSSGRLKFADVAETGTCAVPREHEAFAVGGGALGRAKIPRHFRRILIGGESIRDWGFPGENIGLWPYDPVTLKHATHLAIENFLWPCRTVLARRTVFGKTQLERGLPWTGYSMFFAGRFSGLAISFPVISTGNNYVLDRRQRVFKQSAPVVKMAKNVSEDGYLQLLGVLNSSTACFWLKQVSHNKGEGGGARVDAGYAAMGSEDWKNHYEFTGTKLQEFPLPSAYPLELARELDALAQRLTAVSPAAVAGEATPTRDRLAQAQAEWHATRARMIALQEELDWQVYTLYGLLDDELTASAATVPELRLGERAFEIVLARRMARGEAETQWFARHGSTPITELPGHWTDEFRAVVERRIAVIESNRSIGLIERPECKRRWATEGWDAMQAKALRGWLLDRCEARELWFHHIDGVEQPRPLSTAQLADELRRSPDVLAVAELYAPGRDLAKVLADLVAEEHVPYLAALRYKDSGLAKRADWEQVWDLQRQEDAAPDEPAKRKIRDSIPVPPKYKPADFAKTSYWSNRGKLDVPKERFISYPHAGRDGDPTLLVGWAGWDHREQAQALAILVVEREQTDGWAPDRLTPLLAGLREVLPWVRQWHGEFDPSIGDSPAAVYDGFLAETANRLHLTEEELTGWRPPRTARGRRTTRS